jgi:HK97 family phage portal protein
LHEQASDWSFDNVPYGQVYANQSDLYRTLSWISTAIDVVSDKAAITKLSVMEFDGKEEVDIPNHPFELLLRRPNPMMSRFEFIEALVAYYKLTGNGVIWWNRPTAGAAPAEAWIIPYQNIRPVPDGNLYIKGYIYTSDTGVEVPLEPWEITHFKRFNPGNPFVGLSAIEAIAIGASNDLKQQAFTAQLYGENNGRLPGILAYADTPEDDQWEQMKKDANRASKLRNFLMLRGVGAGGLQWLQNNVSPKDMEFLGQRTFTKEEIWGVLAPGLASVLAINATEANAQAGMGTLIDVAVWPMLVMMAEKLTNDIMPAYGENQFAEFDDIRLTDRTLKLAETAEYAKYHTVDEVRAEFYKDDPLDDNPAGELLISQVNASTASTDTTGIDNFGNDLTGQPGQPFLPDTNNLTDQLPGDMPMMDALTPDQGKELDIWKRKAIKSFKAGGSADTEFVVIQLESTDGDMIHAALKSCKTVEDVSDVFEQFKESKQNRSDPLLFVGMQLKRASDLLERELK